MEPHAPLFPSFTAPLSDLYGASNYRVAEAHAYARDLDDLEREELALEQTVRALVDRKAPPPIGLNFHRANTSGNAASSGAVSMTGNPTSRLARAAPVGLETGSRPSGARDGYHGHVAVDDVEEDDEEEEMEEEDDLEELDDEDEEDGSHMAEDDDELFPEDDEEEDDLEEDDDERAQSDSMDMSM